MRQETQCIWISEHTEVNQYAMFEQDFFLQDTAGGIILRISVDNRYQLYINGSLYPEAQAYSDFPFYKVYDEIEISEEWLVWGENRIRILVYCQREASLTYYPGTPGVIFEVLQDEHVLAYSHIDSTRASSITGYQSGLMERFTWQVSFAFSYDATLLKENFECKQIPVLSKRAECYYKRPIPQLKLGERQAVFILSQGIFTEKQGYRPLESGWTDLHNKDVWHDDGRGLMGDRMQYAALRFVDWHYICLQRGVMNGSESLEIKSEDDGDGIYLLLDLKKEQAGYLELELEAEEDTNILIGFGEHLDDLRVRTSIAGRQFAVSYRASKGKNSFMHTMKRIAGRYLQVHFYCKKIKVTYIGIRSVDYPIQPKKLDLNLNYLQQKIFDVSIDTLKRCMHEHYEDCPWREQALYAMDSRNQILCGYEVFGETALAKASLRLLGLNKREDGFLELCAPSKNTPVIPSFCLIWIVTFAEYIAYTGDTAFAAEMLSTAEELIQLFAGFIKDGLVNNPQGYWNYYEWVPMLDGKTFREGADAPLNALFAWALKDFAEVEELLGNKDKAAEIRDMYRVIQEKYHAAFYCAQEDAYRLSTTEDCREVFPELVQALTVIAGLCRNKKTEISLCERLLTDAFAPRTSLSHMIFIYDALLKDDKNASRVLADIDRKWGDMLFQGATTFWELDKNSESFGRAGSHCHAWSALPAYYYSRLLKRQVQ